AGIVAGKVTAKGEPQAFANVIVLGTKLGTMTDETGTFRIAGVPVGAVKIKVQAIGFEAAIQDVKVDAGATTTVNFALGESKVVKTIEEIEVRAEKRIDTKSSTTKQSITAEKLKDLPVD